jgi:2'-5' RNA ligase
VRLFVAVIPPEPAVADLRAAVGTARAAAPPGLRWADPARWHLTLAFLGEVEERRVDELRERLGRTATRHAPPCLRFAGAGRFGDRVLWVGVDGENDELRRLAASSAAAARHTGIAVDDRPYRPHLTVARADRSARADLRPTVEALHAYAGPPWSADRLHLVRSYLGPTPRHEPLADWLLTGS